MSSQKKFLRKGKCSVCNARGQVVVVFNRGSICGRCDPHLFSHVGEQQKENWLQTGKVFAE